MKIKFQFHLFKYSKHSPKMYHIYIRYDIIIFLDSIFYKIKTKNRHRLACFLNCLVFVESAGKFFCNKYSILMVQHTFACFLLSLTAHINRVNLLCSLTELAQSFESYNECHIIEQVLHYSSAIWEEEKNNGLWFISYKKSQFSNN